MAKRINLRPVDSTFVLRDHIYATLRDAILEMDIYDEATDLRLDERQMADSLGISRTPIREALVRLAREGFVEIQPRKGVFVLRKSLEEIMEMITVWAALESMAARLACDRASKAEIGTLRTMAAQYAQDKVQAQIGEYAQANIRFHQKIFELAGCALLKETADGLFLHMRAVRSRAMSEDDRANRSVVDHAEIVEAIEARDADLAAARVLGHTMRLHDHIARSWVSPAAGGSTGAGGDGTIGRTDVA